MCPQNHSLEKESPDVTINSWRYVPQVRAVQPLVLLWEAAICTISVVESFRVPYFISASLTNIFFKWVESTAWFWYGDIWRPFIMFFLMISRPPLVNLNGGWSNPATTTELWIAYGPPPKKWYYWKVHWPERVCLVSKRSSYSGRRTFCPKSFPFRPSSRGEVNGCFWFP